jgi:pyruvate dehydrogenase E1 component alpha subunit
MEAHTNADDATRYRPEGEVDRWAAADPVARLRTYLTSAGLLDQDQIDAAGAEAETFAEGVRAALNADVPVDPMDLFDHVFAEPTTQLREQREQLAAELRSEGA